ncbi:hypothetical protein [Caminicella sporogenes]|uniref:hypothetical protein n=1 Tax=Caminicella sporogenes TaxID=166485 RepID=UPI0025420F3B|nr:hypothetical protein [Caminicella sporogenes]WIF94320.1 hypothetical protein QNI18_08490 [Caminicella sporogenes]
MFKDIDFRDILCLMILIMYGAATYLNLADDTLRNVLLMSVAFYFGNKATKDKME